VVAEVAVEVTSREEVDLKLDMQIKNPDTRRKVRIKMEKRQRMMARSRMIEGKANKDRK
jgi:hypothetical protein